MNHVSGRIWTENARVRLWMRIVRFLRQQVTDERLPRYGVQKRF